MNSPLPPTAPIPPSITVPSDDKPTLLNSEALDGALIGNFLTMTNSPITEIVGTVGGGVIGGIVGKKRMEKEYEQGKIVSKPASEGLYAGAGALLVGAVGALLASGLRASKAAVAVWAGAGAAVGGFLGDSSYKTKSQEYERAKEYYVKHGGNYLGRAQEAALEGKQAASQISPDDVGALKARIAELEKKSFTQTAAEKKQQGAEAQR